MQLRSRTGSSSPETTLAAGRRLRLEEADPQILRLVNASPIRLEPAVGDAEHQLGTEHALKIDSVHNLLDRRQHLVGELHLANAERAATARRSGPAQEEADHL